MTDLFQEIWRPSIRQGYGQRPGNIAGCPELTQKNGKSIWKESGQSPNGYSFWIGAIGPISSQWIFMTTFFAPPPWGLTILGRHSKVLKSNACVILITKQWLERPKHTRDKLKLLAKAVREEFQPTTWCMNCISCGFVRLSRLDMSFRRSPLSLKIRIKVSRISSPNMLMPST